jgi:hypothetical protein
LFVTPAVASFQGQWPQGASLASALACPCMWAYLDARSAGVLEYVFDTVRLRQRQHAMFFPELMFRSENSGVIKFSRAEPLDRELLLLGSLIMLT